MTYQRLMWLRLYSINTRCIHLVARGLGISLSGSFLKSAVRHFYVEMMGLIGMGNNPMVGATVAVAVAIEEASK